MNTRLLCALALMAIQVSGCGDDSPAGGGGAGGGPATGGAGGEGVGGSTFEGCTKITQKAGASTMYSISAVGFEFEPAMGLDGVEVVAVTPVHIGTVTTGTSNLDGYNGTVWSTASFDAVVDLINAPPDAMDNRLFVATEGVVEIEDAPDTGTQFKGRIKGTLTGVKYREVDDLLEVIDGGDCLYLASGEFDSASYSEDCEAPVDIENTPSGGACLDWENIGHDCNPITNDGCMADEICDWGGYFRCYPVEGNEVGLCGTCMSVRGPHCQVGMTCDGDTDAGTCYRYCCTDEDCGTGATCIAYSLAPTGVGVCFTP